MFNYLINIVFILLLFPSLAVANNMIRDGNQLLSICKPFVMYLDSHDSSNVSVPDSAQCASFINGFREGTDLYRIIYNLREVEIDPEYWSFCIPERVTNNQLIRVIVKYLEDNPSELHTQRSFIIADALHSAFPCE